MLNNLMTHCLGQKNVKVYQKQTAVISVKWFHVIAEIKPELQYEPDNLYLNKACFAK